MNNEKEIIKGKYTCNIAFISKEENKQKYLDTVNILKNLTDKIKEVLLNKSNQDDRDDIYLYKREDIMNEFNDIVESWRFCNDDRNIDSLIDRLKGNYIKIISPISYPIRCIDYFKVDDVVYSYPRTDSDLSYYNLHNLPLPGFLQLNGDLVSECVNKNQKVYFKNDYRRRKIYEKYIIQEIDEEEYNKQKEIADEEK